MKIFDTEFPIDISDQINKILIHNKHEEELIKSGKTHTVMNYVLNNQYFEDLFEEFFLLNAYTIKHGYDEYACSLYDEFCLANQYLSDLLHINAFQYWQQFYIGVFRKVERIKQRIELMLTRSDERYVVYFTTIKPDDRYYINPETVNRENYTALRIKVRKFVKEYSDFYVFNKDFGLHETRRLHFHGCMLMSKGYKASFTRSCEKNFGFCKLEIIDNRTDCLSRYLNKLSKHALKVNYGFNRENLIYSRGFL